MFDRTLIAVCAAAVMAGCSTLQTPPTVATAGITVPPAWSASAPSAATRDADALAGWWSTV